MAGDVTLGDLIRFKRTLAPSYAYATDTGTASRTLAAWQVVGATAAQPVLPASALGPDEVVNDNTGTLAGAANLTLPTAAAILAAMPNAYVGETFKFRVKNSSGGAFAYTVLTNTGLTLTGTMTVAQNTYRDLYFTVTGIGAAAALTVQNVGSGTA